MMNRVILSTIALSLLVILAGCLDYKNYDFPAKGQGEDANLVDEIAAIEEELNADQNATEEKSGAEEEVVLPGFEEKVEEVVDEEGLYTLTAKENDLVVVKANVSDPDRDPITYTFSKPLNQKGEWKTSYGDAGEYIVTLSATDGVQTTEKKIKIVVERVNVPPVLSGVRDITVNEGETVTFQPTVNDPNKDPVTVTISEPLKSGTLVTDHTSAGEYQISVVASDGELETTASFVLRVNNVNVKPEITNLEDITVKEGEVVEVKPVVTDLDEEEITVHITEPVGNDGVWETGYTDHGQYVVTVTADDGKEKVSQKITVTVEDVNKPPEIKDIYLG